MTITEKWAQNGEVTLHYLDGNTAINPSLTPLLHIPGAFGSAESFKKDMEHLAPRRCVPMSLRGRGKSDVPETGYHFDNLVGDIETVVKDAALDTFFLYAFSLGVPPALGYAIKHPEKVKALIIGDYGAAYLKQPIEWTEKFKPFPELVNFTAVLGTQRESEHTPLWDSLKLLSCPVLIMTGGDKNAQPSPVLDEETISMYRSSFEQVTVKVLEDTGHRLWEPSYEAYIDTISSFLIECEKQD